MKNKSKLNTILLVIIIILLVSALGYLLFTSSKNKENKNITANNIVVPSDWKTYKDDDWGFEFKYPPNININSSSYGLRGEVGTINKFKTIDDSADTDIQSESMGGITAIKNSVVVDGQEARTLCNQTSKFCELHIVFPTPVKAPEERYFKFLVFAYDIFPEENLNQILSTFKFTNR